jgi:hypothetical protein
MSIRQLKNLLSPNTKANCDSVECVTSTYCLFAFQEPLSYPIGSCNTLTWCRKKPVTFCADPWTIEAICFQNLVTLSYVVIFNKLKHHICPSILHCPLTQKTNTSSQKYPTFVHPVKLQSTGCNLLNSENNLVYCADGHMSGSFPSTPISRTATRRLTPRLHHQHSLVRHTRTE